jgi:hypothetical protein
MGGTGEKRKVWEDLVRKGRSGRNWLDRQGLKELVR